MKDVKKLHNQHLVEKEGLNEQFNFIYSKYKEKKAEIVRLKEQELSQKKTYDKLILEFIQNSTHKS